MNLQMYMLSNISSVKFFTFSMYILILTIVNTIQSHGLFHLNIHLLGAVGNHEVSEEVVRAYKEQLENQAKELFLPYRCFCTRKDVGSASYISHISFLEQHNYLQLIKKN